MPELVDHPLAVVASQDDGFASSDLEVALHRFPGWLVMQLGFGHLRTPTIRSGRSTGRFSRTWKSRMIEIVAVGAIRAIALNFRGESSMFSTLTMSFQPIFWLRTCNATETVESAIDVVDPQDPQDVEGEAVPDVVDDGPVLDRGKLELPQGGHAAFPVRMSERRAIRTGTPRNACRKYAA